MRVLEARHDVVGLRLIDPNRYLTAPTWITEQDDGGFDWRHRERYQRRSSQPWRRFDVDRL